jgi:hypothetical protein
MVMRVLPVASTSASGRNSSNAAAVNSGLSSSGVLANGAASTLAQSIAGAELDGVSFKSFLFTVTRLSKRNNMRDIFCVFTKHHDHQTAINSIVANKATLTIDLANIFTHQQRIIKHQSRCQQWQTAITNISVIFD